ncbi:thioredoxin [Robertkochia marina]|uniref:Thioredoxin n=1 Tax=Robertkochia marina TaxID=1227945 RepID=A0A4S3M0A0_9FLAO|nr:thioredoxin family protein [Robertkochia marina]THD66333.1 thioredoxin [Robertkochia marina]TRZ44017.1 thioredoxin [Robertkochia marina]
MNNLVILLAALFLAGHGDRKKRETSKAEITIEVTEMVSAPQDTMLLGLQKRKVLEQAPYSSWYKRNYKEYKPDPEMVGKLKPLIGDVEVAIFMGAWCHDSKREVPALYKLLDALDFPEEKVALIFLDRDKETPDHLEEGLEINNSPTMIFKRNGKELNRIVEFPMESMEEDMYKILSGQEYKHAYDW